MRVNITIYAHAPAPLLVQCSVENDLAGSSFRIVKDLGVLLRLLNYLRVPFSEVLQVKRNVQYRRQAEVWVEVPQEKLSLLGIKKRDGA